MLLYLIVDLIKDFIIKIKLIDYIMSDKEMLFTTAVILYAGISFVGGSLLGMVIGNQVTRRNMRNQQAQEFEYWIGSFEDEGSESDLGITETTPHGNGFETFETVNLHRGFPTVPIRRR